MQGFKKYIFVVCYKKLGPFEIDFPYFISDEDNEGFLFCCSPLENDPIRETEIGNITGKNQQTICAWSTNVEDQQYWVNKSIINDHFILVENYKSLVRDKKIQSLIDM